MPAVQISPAESGATSWPAPVVRLRPLDSFCPFMGTVVAVHYGTPPAKNQIDNDVIWGILCSPVEGYTNHVTQICRASFAWQFAVREVKSAFERK